MEANGKRPALAWLWGLVPLLIAAELVVQWRIPEAEPSAEEWRAAAASVRAQRRPGDLVLIAPDWATQARMYLGDALPIADFGRFDAAPYGRFLEVSVGGARAPETAGLEPEAVAGFGRLAVRRYANPGKVEVLYDFAAEAPRATVTGGGKGRARLVIDHWFRPRLAVPLKLSTAPRRLIYEGVPLDGALRAYAVVGYREGRFDKGLPIRLAVWVNGARVLSREVANFAPIEPAEARLPGGVGTVAFEFSAPNILAREFAVGGYVYRTAGGAR